MPPIEAAAPDRLVHAVAADGGIRIRTLVATGVAAEAAARHRTSPLATAALGRTLLGALLLGSLGQDEETVQVRFSGNGPLRTLNALADARGRVRGFAGDPNADLPARGGRPDVSRGIGLGRLSVLRFAPGWREPYTGIVPIVSGEIAQDLALYLTESEQTPSALAVGLRVGREGEVEAAAGFVAQALPGADPDRLAQIESNVRGAPPVSELVGAGAGAAELLDTLLGGVGGRQVDETAPEFYCGCSERVERAVALLGREELAELIERREPVEVRCEFCSAQHLVDPERARTLLADA